MSDQLDQHPGKAMISRLYFPNALIL